MTNYIAFGYGCATGLLGIAVIADKPERTGVLFDQLPAALIEESIGQAGLEGRAEAVSGNFLTDDLGVGYDLILAVSVMLFAKGRWTRCSKSAMMRSIQRRDAGDL